MRRLTLRAWLQVLGATRRMAGDGSRAACYPSLGMKVEAGPSGAVQREADESHGAARPRLIFFFSPTSGRSRRTERYLAHTLQRRGNHATFALVRVNVEECPDLVDRFRIEVAPTLLVLVGPRVVRRIVSPSSARELESELGAWLR